MPEPDYSQMDTGTLCRMLLGDLREVKDLLRDGSKRMNEQDKSISSQRARCEALHGKDPGAPVNGRRRRAIPQPVQTSGYVAGALAVVEAIKWLISLPG